VAIRRDRDADAGAADKDAASCPAFLQGDGERRGEIGIIDRLVAARTEVEHSEAHSCDHRQQCCLEIIPTVIGGDSNGLGHVEPDECGGEERHYTR
jgi:hypothetical protein